MDRTPENAKFHFDIKLGDVIRSKGGALKTCKSIVHTMKMVYDLDAEAISYRKAVGVKFTQERLKELIWQVLDPETKVECKRNS